MKFRLLKEDEIDVKIGTITAKGVTLLLYKNARVDMAILDETVGAENWQRDHKEVKNNLYCGIGINVRYQQDYSVIDKDTGDTIGHEKVLREPLWVWKWDCGVESAFGDKEKGEASDSFKRAGFNWGIGRELYTSPLIFVDCKTELKDKNDIRKGYQVADEDRKKFYGLKVAKIEYNEKREITNLVIVDGQGCQIYPKAFSRTETPTNKIVVEKTCVCEKCGEGVTEKVANYSKDKYGKVLCFDCQKKEA